MRYDLSLGTIVEFIIMLTFFFVRKAFISLEAEIEESLPPFQELMVNLS